MARASSAKKTGGNWLPVAAAATEALDDMRNLYKCLLTVRNKSYFLQDGGKHVTPTPSEWDQVLDHVQVVAERLRKGLKGR